MSGHSGHPGAEILIKGEPLPTEVFNSIARVTVRSRMYGSDTFTVEFDAGPNHWQDSPHFPLGGEVTIKMGQQDDLQTVHEGDLTAYFIEFLHRKGTKFVFRGHDRSHRLHRVVRFRSFQAQCDSDVIKDMVGDHGLTASVDDSPMNGEVRVQFNQTDHAFIRDRARRLGWLYRVEGNELTFKAPTFEDSGKSYSVDKEIFSFDIGLEMSPIPTKVKVWGWDPVKKEQVSHEAKPGEEWWGPVAKSAGHKLSDKAFGENVVMVSDLAIATPDEATEIAQGVFERMTEKSLQGPVLVRGDPELKVGNTVYLEGLGPALEGNYLMLEVTHIWTRDGMFSRLQVGRNAVDV